MSGLTRLAVAASNLAEQSCVRRARSESSRQAQAPISKRRAEGESMMDPKAPRNCYRTVALNSGVLTLDEQPIGVVSEIRGMYFKVKTRWWQRNYWLRTDSVRSSEPGQPVVLNVPRVGLEDIKMVEEPLVPR